MMIFVRWPGSLRRGFKAFLTILLFQSALTAKADYITPGFDKNVVQFVYLLSGTNFIPDGTCFCVKLTSTHSQPNGKIFGLPLIGRPTINLNYLYFVTAKHVVFDDTGTLRSNLCVRLSKWKGGIQFDRLDDTNTIRILTHPDKSVDLAVITFQKEALIKGMQAMPNPVKTFEKTDHSIKLAFIQPEQIGDSNAIRKLGIREGNPMSFLGLFTPFVGSEENLPIWRFGRLSMLTSEKIPWGPEGPQNLYLMETGAFGGNSGAPAFFTVKHTFGHETMVLAGVVKGYFSNIAPILSPATNSPGFSRENMGVAVVVPAYQVRDILFSDAEKKLRAEVDDAAFPRKSARTSVAH